MFTQKESENADKFNCECCGFVCSKKSNFNKHLLTRKHQTTYNALKKEAEIKSKKYTCDCGKEYKYRQSLYTHKKICVKTDNSSYYKNINNNNPENIDNITNLLLEIVKNNSELQKQNHELKQQVIDICKTNTTNITTMNSNNNNKTFNLQFFLNEQCKDAMNIMDFVNSLTLQFSDLESVGKLGYVEGISNIMIKKLNEMDVYKRPVHCSDAKRETLYVKDNNIWEKENETHSKLRRAIKYISKKNSDLLLAWSNEHPASKNIHSKQNEEYMKMIYQAMGGVGDVEENENKIIKKISKMVLIEKNNN